MSHNTTLPRSAPETQGIPSSAILAFIDDVEKHVHDLHSFMLVRHGQVVAEGWWSPYSADRPHVLYSLSKSFASTAVGLAVAEGRLSIDDPVLGFFPDEVPPAPGENLKSMRVRHLLSMSTGHSQDATASLLKGTDDNWARRFFVPPVEHAPGTHFVYNSAATYMLSAIVQKLTGMTLVDYLTPRLFEPLGIQNATWETCPRGINTGGWGLNLKTEDIARFGQLYLQKGMWHGQQVVPADWIAQATSAHVPNGPSKNPDWEQGYGFQFWRCQHGAYRGDGAFGQYCIVMPEQDAVLAITGGLGDMQMPLNLVWQHLLPAMQPASLPADTPAREALTAKLATLHLAPAQGRQAIALAGRINGKTYSVEPNDQKIISLRFDFAAHHSILTVRDDRGQHSIRCGHGSWIKSQATFDTSSERPVAASSAWTSDDTWIVNLCMYETPFCPTLTCRFAGDQVTFDHHANVAFGPLDRPQLIGQLNSSSDTRATVKTDTSGEFAVYSSPYYVLACAKDFPMVAHLGIDSGGRSRRPIDNTLLRPGLGGTVVCGSHTSFALPCPGVLGTSTIHYDQIPFGNEQVRSCTVTARDERAFTLRVDAGKNPLRGEFFQLATAPDVAPVTIWATRHPATPTNRHDQPKSLFSPRVIATSWQLPAVLHFPDYGLVKVEGSTPGIYLQAHIIPDRTNAGLAVGVFNRSIHSAFRAYTLGTVLLSFHAQNDVPAAEITFTVLDENYPKLDGCDFSHAKFSGLKRCWQNAFAVNPEQHCMADNLLINGIAQLSMAFKSDMVVFTPSIGGGESMLQATRRALEQTFATRVKPDDGRIHDYAWESNEVCLIALYDYLVAGGDWQLVRDNLANIRLATKSTLNCDTDGDGILETPFDGNQFQKDYASKTLNWWDDFAFGHKDGYFNLLAHRALRHMRELFAALHLDDDVRAIDAHLALFRANFDKTFYNPATGVYAGWISRDGNVHDYMFTFISAMAINEGLIQPDRARAILVTMLARMQELGYDFVYGVPGPLISVDPKDRGEWEAMSRWGIYENGGLCGQTAYHFIQALYNVGMREQADKILFTMLDTFEREPTHSGLFPGYFRSVDWRTKGGAPCGYNYLADNYYFLLAAITGHFGIKFPPLPKPQDTTSSSKEPT